MKRLALTLVGLVACGGKILLEEPDARAPPPAGPSEPGEPRPPDAPPGLPEGGAHDAGAAGPTDASSVTTSDCPPSSLVGEPWHCTQPGITCLSSIGPCNETDIEKRCVCDPATLFWRCEACR
jgi:hypothetical protein